MPDMEQIELNGVVFDVRDPTKAPAKTPIYQMIETPGWYRIGQASAYAGHRLLLSSLYSSTTDFTAIIDLALSYADPIIVKTAFAKTGSTKVVDQIRLVKSSTSNSSYYIDFHYQYTYGSNPIIAHIDSIQGWSELYKSYETITDNNIDGTVIATLAL